MSNNYWCGRLKHIRKNILDLSQKQVADEIGCVQTYISLIEKNGNAGTNFFKYLNYLAENNINLNWIFKEDNELEPIRKDQSI